MFKNKGKEKEVKLKKRNIFRNCKKNDIIISGHFLERWNERVGRIKFRRKEDLEEYIRLNYEPGMVENLYGDHYFINDLLGGIYITATLENGKVVLITTLGTYENNPVIMNVILSGMLNKSIKQYGKINIAYSA